MAITTYKTFRNGETFQPKAGETISRTQLEHWGDCPHNTNKDYYSTEDYPALHADCSPKCYVGHFVQTHVGLVVNLYERNGYSDSDFFAVVINPETLETKDICYATTRGWTYNNGASIDAPAELIQRWQDKKDAARIAAALAAQAADEVAKAQIPYCGNRVAVVSKRSKLPCGMVGTVIYFERSAYAKPERKRFGGIREAARLLADLSNYRVGIRDITGKVHFCSASCVKVVD